MSDWAQNKLRDDAKAARANLAGLMSTLEHVQGEQGHRAEQLGQIVARRHELHAAVFAAKDAGAALAWDADGGRPRVVAELAGAGQAAVAMDAAQREMAELDEQEREVASRQAQLDHLVARIKRAITLETPRVAGLEAELARLDAPQPPPVPVRDPEPELIPSDVYHAGRLASLGKRLGLG